MPSLRSRRVVVVVVVHGEAGSGRSGGSGGSGVGGSVGAASAWQTAILSPNASRLVAILIAVLCLASLAAGGIPSRLPASDAVERAPPPQMVDEAEPRNNRRIIREAVEDNNDFLHKTGTSFTDRGDQEPQQNSFLADEDVRLSDVGDQDAVVGDAGTDDGDGDPSARVAPRYMLELYRKFSNDKYSHPIANIVRSFLNINTGVRPTWTTGNRTRIALHTLLFNISSVNRDEEIHLAELRLYAAKKTQRVLVYEVVHQMTPASSSAGTSTTDAPEDGAGAGGGDPAAGSRHYQLLTTREIIPRGHGDWQTFAVTEVVRRWVRTQATAGHILEVRVDTSRADDTDEDYEGDEGADEEERQREEEEGLEDVERVEGEEEEGEGGEEKSAFEPILVVFSNDRKRRKIELRELHEIQSHENGVADEDDPSSSSSSSSSSSIYSSSTSSVLSGGDEEEEEYEDEDDRDRVRLNATATGGGDGGNADYRDVEDRGYPPQPMESLSKSTGDRVNTPSPWKTQPRVKRSVTKGNNRRRRAKRNSCRRKPMWVDFGDVQWDRWIIEPQGYQAYECTGQCYFPVGENLTPTKYAMIKSLLHATYPKRVAAVCCVPTKLDPISLLYIDEHGTVTYKYKYDGMVVAECGCR